PFQMLTWATYSPDGRTLAVGEQTSGNSGISEGGLAFYDNEARSYQEVSPHHHDYIKLGAFSPDGRRLVTVSQGDAGFKSDGKQVSEPPMVMLWDAGKRSLVATLAHTDRVNTAFRQRQAPHRFERRQRPSLECRDRIALGDARRACRGRDQCGLFRKRQ